MSAFRFRLERVLRVRRVLEDEARAAWLAADGAARAAEAEAAGRRAERENAERALGVERAGLGADEVLWRYAALDRMTWDAARTRERARSLRFQALRAREPFEGRRRDRRALERLRERAWDRHRDEQERAELARLDEVAVARSAARRIRQE